MADDQQHVKINGIGTHQIDIEALDHGVRERLMECIRKNGKISIIIGQGKAAGAPVTGYAQQID